MAQIIQKAIENEFSGFVDVFVSSDGASIPIGANFLKRIEDGLISCIGAIYLISPISVKRNWINFELGAAWIRNLISQRNSEGEIPTIPICHSGMLINLLPMPLANLNAIYGNNAAQLELAFKSIQNAVGGKGTLKTDFDDLAKQIIDFENDYTLGESLVKLFTSIKLTKKEMSGLIEHCKTMPRDIIFPITLGFRDSNCIQILRSLESTELKGYLTVKTGNMGIGFSQTEGGVGGGEVMFEIHIDLIIRFEELLRNKVE